ncbi:putative gustatory receptor 28b [Cryptotermes secundus]|uniref:putative gustatory receptor 28b n=1 Tax=Cryptotermes secundus TaxID=105785 RepID=UPI001454BEEC|nr:putative gustatory receptor 28b [Cryptotermes secundus]
MEFVAQKMSFLCNAGESIPYFICLLYYALHLIWLVYFTSFTSKEMNRTAVVVHRFLCKTNDLVLREELQEFSLQLLHRKVKFTACGFFPLDYTLFYSIVGAVTTYLVILIQFQLALPDSNKNMTTGIETYLVTPDSSENHYPHQ